MEEKMSDKLVVCMGKGAQKDLAVSLAKKINVPLVEKLGEQLTVLVDSKGVSLCGFGLSYQGLFWSSIFVTKTTDKFQYCYHRLWYCF